MIIIKTEEEIEKMDRAGDIVSGMHEALRDFIEVGKTTKEINDFCEEYIRSHGGIPSQINYQGYPYATCTSVNDEICHGFPTDYKLQNHDIITVDTVVELDGFLADSAWSYQVGEPTELTKKLMDVTKEALYIGIEQAVVGNRLGDIGFAIQDFVESQGFSVVRDFTGHGIGKEMHEDPMVLHYGKAGRGQRLIEGMVLTIEPMVNTGKWNSKLDSNGWTARTVDKGLSCQYEHTLAITKDGPRILTLQKD
ncbi:type I methionyl aminopeptidase [Gallicola sp. Sow4_E12]|uniref:type I methionyl aminopeptidase n=1 Tax=Gallicola sp. Sow4_E12 TaxID=3438785 RepID=UPI003F8F93B3